MIARRVLITNIDLWPRSGTVLYVRDLALALKRRGHLPSVFTHEGGDIVTELRATGIPVSSTLDSFADRPDVIHGHHHALTLTALGHWRGVPAISICHDHIDPHARTPRHSRIRRYFGVSRVCVERMVHEGVPRERAEYLLNFVDTERFGPRPPLPNRPRRALVFSNYASEETQLPAIRAACASAGLELDVIGSLAGRDIAHPETILAQYDIVFAKAKAAMEAIAVGCAVILCDYAGAGPLVTSDNFDRLRPMNFGFEALVAPLEAPYLATEIARYDAADAARVRDRLRAEGSLERAVDNLLAIYEDVMAEQARAKHGDSVLDVIRTTRARLSLAAYWKWLQMPSEKRDAMLRVPGFRAAKDGVARLFGVKDA